MTDERDESSPDPQSARAIAERLLRDQGWSLISAAALAEKTMELLNGMPQRRTTVAGARLADDILSVAVLRSYAEVLFEAFECRQGEDQQRRAYDELLRYVFAKTGRLEPGLTRDEREEIACEVVAELYYRVRPDADGRAPRVRVPGAFLAVALQQTRNAVRRWRRVSRHMLQLDADDGPDGITAEVEREVGEADAVYAQLERRAIDAEVRAAYAEALRRHPRATTQLAVVWMRHILELDYETIAATLGIDANTVRMLYHRGCKRLRSDPELRALADDAQLVRVNAPARGS
jgi:DNA-directed RNA polymerase specialized sigma24 family protein